MRSAAGLSCKVYWFSDHVSRAKVMLAEHYDLITERSPKGLVGSCASGKWTFLTRCQDDLLKNISFLCCCQRSRLSKRTARTTHGPRNPRAVPLTGEWSCILSPDSGWYKRLKNSGWSWWFDECGWDEKKNWEGQGPLAENELTWRWRVCSTELGNLSMIGVY